MSYYNSSERYHGSEVITKVVSYPDGNERFEYVYDKDGQARAESHDSYCVGHSGIAAALLAYVYALQLTYDDGRIYIAQGICSQSYDYESCDLCAAHLRSPLFSFQTNLIDVPSKSNASLILFSRYLAYEKCMSSLSLMLNENSGGFVPICVT